MAKVLQKNNHWKKVFSSVAPVLGMALGGPLASMACKMISGVLFPGRSTVETPKKLDELLSNGILDDVRTLEKLKILEHDFVTKMRQLDVDIMELEFKDRSSARERQSKTKDLMPNYLAVFVLIGFFSTVAFVLCNGLGHLDSVTAAFAGTLVGYISAKADQVIAYFFGSSSGSKEKTKALEKFLQDDKYMRF